MNITVGTFNLNNLFSRYNFRGEIEAIKKNDTGVASAVKYEFTAPETFRLRTYKGRLVKGKPDPDRQTIAARIKNMNVDVLAAQEIEDIDILRQFIRDDLAGMYPHEVLVEGNDPRLIDLAILSKVPIGAIVSYQREVHPANPNELVFSRDLLEVEVLNMNRTQKLFTLFNNHLKSHFVDFDQDPVTGTVENDQRRTQQAETITRIIKARIPPNSDYMVVGDMNDPADSVPLAPLVADATLNLTNALANPVETRPPKNDNPMPATTSWTHRFKESGKPAKYELFDQIWLSPSLALKQTGAWIDRRTKHSGDGSDHDPAWIGLNL
jgi:endonuclease/exonuclease/phosphatase family metal-dependent hydrolase